MKIQFLRQPADFSSLQQAWNGLLAEAITKTPFQLAEYQEVWWSTRGGGEWQTDDLWIAAGYGESGELVGLAPLFFAQQGEHAGSLLFLGSIEISDYLDLIVSTAYLESFIDALFEGLDEGGPADWAALDLYNLPEGSPSVEILTRTAERRGWAVERQSLQPCPIVFLPDNWEAYLDQLGSKQARELRRKLRKADGYPATVDWKIVRERSELEPAVETFLELMANDPAKDEFLSEAMRTHFRRMCAAGFDRGWLHLSFLTVTNEPVFAYVNFDFGDRLWVYNSGFNPDHFDLSPGWVLMGKLIEWAIDEGRRAVDFLRGDEAYKYRLGGQDRHIVRLTIHR